MSWSLEIRNGDFALTGSNLGTLKGSEKMLQDLRHYILERMGTDTAHPGYGSLIDGGVTPDGTVHRGVIGNPNFDFAQLEVEADIARIIREYQGRQLSRAKYDKMTYGRATLTPDEVVLGVSSIRFEQVLDQLQVFVVIQNGQGREFDLNFDLTL
jgi:hypothetical protein